MTFGSIRTTVAVPFFTDELQQAARVPMMVRDGLRPIGCRRHCPIAGKVAYSCDLHSVGVEHIDLDAAARRRIAAIDARTTC